MQKGSFYLNSVYTNAMEHLTIEDDSFLIGNKERVLQELRSQETMFFLGGSLPNEALYHRLIAKFEKQWGVYQAQITSKDEALLELKNNPLYNDRDSLQKAS
jgi:hypothetical protein